MTRKHLYQFLFAGAIICALVVAPFGFNLWSQGESNDGGIRLAAPNFVKQAHAKEAAAAEMVTVLGEAGFSAYFRKDSGIDLDDVEGLYRTVEDRTDTYIIGSIDIDDYGEAEAPHVFITTDGWVMAYYRAFYPDGTEIPISRIIDIVNYDGTEFNTKLKSVLNKAAAAISVPASFTPIYYHFQYPNATHLTILGESAPQNVAQIFQAKIPGSFTYYSIGWSTNLGTRVAASGTVGSLSLNGTTIINRRGYSYGALPEERIYDFVLNSGVMGAVFLYEKE